VWGKVGVLVVSTLLIVEYLDKTHRKSIHVGPPPGTKTLGDLPVLTIVRLDIAAFVVGDTEAFVESGDEAFLVGLVRVEVSSGTGISLTG
jgi:hypothetical protein